MRMPAKRRNRSKDYEFINTVSLVRVYLGELEKQEQGICLDFILESQCVDSTEDYQDCVSRCINSLFPHEMTLVCVGALMNDESALEVAVAVDCPEAFFKNLHEIVSIGDLAMLARWYMERKSQIISHGISDQVFYKLERNEIGLFEFNKLSANWVVEIYGKKGSYISLTRIRCPLTEHHSVHMELMISHIHQILVRFLRFDQKPSVFCSSQLLSLKELIVLRWLAAGKSNPEIAILISRSFSTISNHVCSFLGKLNAFSRKETLVKAYKLKLL